MGRATSGLWVNGWYHEYAVGRQKGSCRYGAIFHEPAKARGAAVTVADPHQEEEDPWVCGCDSFQGAVFAAAEESGGGWTWVRNDAGGETELYFCLEVPVPGAAWGPTFRDLPARREVVNFLAMTGWKLSCDEHFEMVVPVIVLRGECQHYARYHVVAEGNLRTMEGRFPSFALTGGSVLTLLAVVRD